MTQAWRLNSLNLGNAEKYEDAVFFLSNPATREKLKLSEWLVGDEPVYRTVGGIEPERFQGGGDLRTLKGYLSADRAGRITWAMGELDSPTNRRSAIWELEHHDLDEPGVEALVLAVFKHEPMSRLVRDEAIYLLRRKPLSPATAAFLERAAKDKTVPSEWRRRFVCCLDTAMEGQGHRQVEKWPESDDPILREGAEDAKEAARSYAKKVSDIKNRL